ESIGEPHFYSYAIVPIDVENEVVKTSDVWTQEEEAELAITSGLYVMAFKQQFDKLDKLLEKIAEKHSLVGERIEMKANTQGNGYNTSYYFVTSGLTTLFELYHENPS